MLVALVLLSGCAAAEEDAEPENWTYEITQESYPLYFFNLGGKAEKDFPLYFVDGAEDLPFVDLRDWPFILNSIFQDDSHFDGYHVTATVDEDTGFVTIGRENGSRMACNFADGEIVFDDFNAFRKDSSGLYINIAWTSKSDPEKTDVLGVTSSRERLGKSVVLKLRKEYGIPMIAQDGKYLVPLQTLSFLNLSHVGTAGFFNRKALIFCSVGRIKDPETELISILYAEEYLTYELWEEAGEKTGSYQERVAYVLEEISRTENGRAAIEYEREMLKDTLPDLYYSGPRGERSEALATYGYNELCMELDFEYGLQEAHQINGFEAYFEQTGLTAKLLDLDAAVADNAIGELTDFWFDDGHSAYLSNSYLAGNTGSPWRTGFSIRNSQNTGEIIGAIRRKYPEADEPYYEVGNTAYITFDSFDVNPAINAVSDYYQRAEEDDLPDDTITLLIEAHRKITRENSPIQNVVLDLSCNGGGAVTAGVFALCWFLGEAQVSVTDPATGAESTVSFRADINLDHQYDEKDTLSGLNLYCLISSQSFSCGNLVPWAFKADGRVTLLGKTSGGGSCVVRMMATPWGSTYQISGSSRISFVKNGSYYDVDKGVDPDYFIRDYNNFYNREALTEIINGIR